MNKLMIIGNLTRDPEYSTPKDLPCCTFTVAVNKRVKAGAPPKAEFIRVTTWRGLADLCAKYLAKGRKVACIGAVEPHAWINNQTGEMLARLEMVADEVEFLSSRRDADADGYVETDEETPFDE